MTELQPLILGANHVINLFFTGVSKAIDHINSTLAPALVGQVRAFFMLPLCFSNVIVNAALLFCVLLQGLPVVDQERIDQIMIDLDGTDNKCKYDIQYVYFTSLGWREQKKSSFGPEVLLPLHYKKNSSMHIY